MRNESSGRNGKLKKQGKPFVSRLSDAQKTATVRLSRIYYEYGAVSSAKLKLGILLERKNLFF